MNESYIIDFNTLKKGEELKYLEEFEYCQMAVNHCKELIGMFKKYINVITHEYKEEGNRIHIKIIGNKL